MITTLKIWMICWFIINFEPLSIPIQNFFINLINQTKNLFIKKSLETLFEVIGCLMCLSFWSVLILTLNPIYAIGAAMAGQMYSKLFMK